jgi:hypothetical protein
MGKAKLMLFKPLFVDLQGSKGSSSYSADFPPGPLRITIDDVTSQGRDLFFSVAQWRKRNRKNI